MVLTREELIGKLRHEVRTLFHLISKVDPGRLDYRPTPNNEACGQMFGQKAGRGSWPTVLRHCVADCMQLFLCLKV